MKSIGKIVMAAGILLCAGCTTVAKAEQTTDDTDVVTAYGTVESVSDGNVVISYESEDNQTVSETVPESVMVLKNSSTMHSDDLKKDEDISVSFTNGKMSVINVLQDQGDTQSSNNSEDAQKTDSSEQESIQEASESH